jgi:hypothetical protein
VAGGQGVGVIGAEDPLADGKQGGELVAGPGRVPRIPGPVSEVRAGDQSVGAVGAADPLEDGQQGCELVAGPSRVPRLPGVAGEVSAGGQGARVVGAVDPVKDGQQGDVLVAGPSRGPQPRPPPLRSRGRGCGGRSECRGGLARRLHLPSARR